MPSYTYHYSLPVNPKGTDGDGVTMTNYFFPLNPNPDDKRIYCPQDMKEGISIEDFDAESAKKLRANERGYLQRFSRRKEEVDK